MKKAIIAFPMIEAVIEKAKTQFNLIYQSDRPLDLKELIELCQKHQPEALMIGMRHSMSAEVIAQMPSSVKVIATASVGYDHLDLKAAREKKIFMTNTPDVLTEATADMGFLLMLAAARRLPEAMGTMRAGWGKAQGFAEGLGHDLRGKNLAIFGMGRIGQALAEKGRAFGMKILYSNRKRLSVDLEKDAVYFRDLKSMLPHAQVLSLNAPATVETQKIMNKETFALMPKGSIFVNVARGSLVDEEALIEALRSRHLFAAGLDVFSQEPQVDPRFLDLPNVVLAPHIGSATIETRTAMGLRALENMQAAVDGKTPRDNLL